MEKVVNLLFADIIGPTQQVAIPRPPLSPSLTTAFRHSRFDLCLLERRGCRTCIIIVSEYCSVFKLYNIVIANLYSHAEGLLKHALPLVCDNERTRSCEL